MGDTHPAPEERYAALASAFAGDPDVTVGSPGGRGFGSSALKTGGRIFAMLAGGALVVKLPRGRVDALVASGDGERFDPGHGRRMKEWMALAPMSEEGWLPLAREAKAFVASRER